MVRLDDHPRRRAEDVGMVSVMAAVHGRRGYLIANSFEFLIALLSVVTAITFLFDPGELSQTAWRQVPEPWPAVWNLLYGLGGALVIVGLVAPRARLELAGLIFLVTAVVCNAYEILQITTTVPALFTYVAVVGACGVRLWVLLAVPRRQGD